MIAQLQQPGTEHAKVYCPARQQPRSLGQAGRIPGVSPADIAVLMVYLQANPIMSGKEEDK